MEITGIVIHAMEMRSGVSQRTGNPWASRDYVLEIPGQYTRHIVFTVFGEDKIRDFALRKDETVTVSFDIDANEYQGKWYNKVTAWKVERPGQSAAQAPQSVPQPQPAPYASQVPTAQGSSADDLPF